MKSVENIENRRRKKNEKKKIVMARFFFLFWSGKHVCCDWRVIMMTV